MALLWLDGFEGYGTSLGDAPSPSGVMGRRYIMSAESGVDIQTGRLSGYCIKIASSSTEIATPTLTTDPTMIVGFAFKLHAAEIINIVILRDGVNTGINVRSTATGEVEIRRGTTTLDTTSGLGLTIETWYWLELKVLTNNSTGTYELKIGGTTVLSDTGVDTQVDANAYHDNVYFDPAYGISIDDFFVCDGTGSVNNDFLGNQRIIAIRPSSNGTTNQWTPSAGNNYECVDEHPINDDTDYVESSTATHLDLYNYEDVSDLGDIAGIQINTICRETDATSYNIITTIRSGGSNYDDSGQAVGTTNYITRSRLEELDPDTSAAWTMSGINSAEFGYKVN